MKWTTILLLVMLLSRYLTDACGPGETQCGNTTQCIPSEWFCDGFGDCFDESDESDCDPCYSSPCQNNGTCSKNGTDYSCACTRGYKGTHCDFEPCSSIPCQHEGKCTSHRGEYICSCITRYTGSNCETELDDCYSHPCQHNGTCYANRRGYRCRCQPGYKGSRCQTSPCSSRPCMNGGSCVTIGGRYECVCAAGYTGARCKTIPTTTTTEMPVSVVLKDGPGAYSGKVLIRLGREWGTVCNDDFDENDARVICRMLGFTNFVRVLPGIKRIGSGKIWLNNLKCLGNESSVLNCPHSGYEAHNCRLEEDVSISCSNNIEDIRLKDGVYNFTGRLEVKINGVWGTVCHDLFNNASANVACMMLGYNGTSRYIPEVLYPGNGHILLDNVVCDGTESSLMDCSHNEVQIHNCTHTQDVHLACIDYVEGIRLRGSYKNAGRVEIRARGEWGTICDDGFGSAEAAVLCRMLGFTGSATYSNQKYPGAPSRIWLDDLFCTGRESRISVCDHRPFGIHNCNHTQDVAIKCMGGVSACASGPCQHGGICTNGPNNYTCKCPVMYSDTNCSPGCASQPCIHGVCSNVPYGYSCKCATHFYGKTCSRGLRLTGGTRSEGTVKIHLNGLKGKWGGLCGKDFGNFEARALCRTLSYRSGIALPRGGYSYDLIWHKNYQCNGTESSIFDCPYTNDSCRSSKDIRVRCS